MDPASYPTPPPAPRCLPATPRWPRPPCHCQSRGSSLEAPFCGEEVSDLPLPSLAPWHPDGASQPPGQGPALLSPSSRAFGGPRLEARAGPPQVKGQRDLRVNRTQLSPALPSPPSSGGFWLKRDTGPHWPGSGVPAQSLGWLLDDALASSLAALAQPTCWTEPDQPGPTGPEDAGRSSTHHPRPRPSAPSAPSEPGPCLSLTPDQAAGCCPWALDRPLLAIMPLPVAPQQDPVLPFVASTSPPLGSLPRTL